MLRRYRPSPSMGVALVALFVALGGSAYAATGGNFVLGSSNAANKTTGLTGSPATGAALSVTNSTAKQPAAAFTVQGRTAPFTVSSKGKVANLNADSLDGIDSTGFVQGNGQAYGASLDYPADSSGTDHVVTVAPGFMALDLYCSAPSASATAGFGNISAQPANLFYALDVGATPQQGFFDIPAGNPNWAGFNLGSGDAGSGMLDLSMQGGPGGQEITTVRVAGKYRSATTDCHFQVQAVTTNS